MFIDWLTISQEHDHDLPIVGNIVHLTVDENTNQVLSTCRPRFKHEGSFSTSITIHIQGRKIRVEGNPSYTPTLTWFPTVSGWTVSYTHLTLPTIYSV